MLSFLPAPLKGILAILFYVVNTISLCSALFVVALIKLITPINAVTAFSDRILINIATLWISINAFTTSLFCNIDWDIRGARQLEKNEWYLVLSNHQSWVDILVLQNVLNRKIPMLKFFLKKELIWVPFLGIAWWALDFPFMKRYSKKLLQEIQFMKKQPKSILKLPKKVENLCLKKLQKKKRKKQ